MAADVAVVVPKVKDGEVSAASSGLKSYRRVAHFAAVSNPRTNTLDLIAVLDDGAVYAAQGDEDSGLRSRLLSRLSVALTFSQDQERRARAAEEAAGSSPFRNSGVSGTLTNCRRRFQCEVTNLAVG